MTAPTFIANQFNAGSSAPAVAEALIIQSDQYRKAVLALRAISGPGSWQEQGCQDMAQSLERLQADALQLSGIVMAGGTIPVNVPQLLQAAIRRYIIRLGRLVNASGMCEQPLVAARMQQAHAALLTLEGIAPDAPAVQQ